MLSIMFHLNLLFIFILYIVGICSELTKPNDTWSGKWFPQDPRTRELSHGELNELFGSSEKPKLLNETWQGKWFPRTPKDGSASSKESAIVSTFPSAACDDGKTNIDVDFDPNDSRHSYNYLCLANRSKYEPNFSTFPIQREHYVPPAYQAPSYCLNETILYEDRLPTFGAHRYLYPKYGEYKFLPIQRWLHNVEYGAIVMLFHPCANKMQIEALRNTLNACLYRRIITPTTLLLPDRPLALVAWSKSLEMSVVSVPTVVDFIKDNAKKGPKSNNRVDQEYDAGLLIEARLVTDEQDSELCANVNSK